MLCDLMFDKERSINKHVFMRRIKRSQIESELKCWSRPRDEFTALFSSRHPTRLFAIHSQPRTMADAQIQTFRQTGLLQMPEPMDADVALPAADNFTPNGLLGSHLTKQPSLSIPDMLLHSTSVTPTSPFTYSGLFDSERVETGACSM
jgi:hypothetical protein